MKKVMSILMAVAILFTMYCGVFAYGDITPSAKLDSTMTDNIKIIIGTMQWFGYAIAIGMLVFIGIKYVMASANEKADLKQSLVKYVIGAVLIVFATTIAKWVFSLNGGNEKVKAGTSTNGSGIAIET